MNIYILLIFHTKFGLLIKYFQIHQVMNSQYHFDQTYLTCVADHMNEVKPFGEDPRKMASTVKRSMVAVRALVKALKSGFKIAGEMKKVFGINNSAVLRYCTYLNTLFL